jgi:DMSO/TMAO reductase YedYZ molybdopterin-dependent catalytic subunit
MSGDDLSPPLRMRRALLAGVVAGAAAALLEVLLRTLAGVSLPAELAADRVLPLVPVDAFLALLGRFGGPIAAKEQAFWGGLGGVVAAAVAGSLAWAWLRRRAWGGHATLAALAAVTVAAVAALWPAPRASYAGLLPAAATAVTVAGLVATVALATLLARALQRPGAPARSGRREVLLAGAGLALLAVTGGLAARLFADGAFGYDGRRLLGPERLPVTPADQFYTVTKNLVDPDVDAALWRLEVTGAVTRPFTLTLDELRAFASRTQETTLECISNGVGYGLLSNGVWTGPPLAALLERAGPSPAGRTVELLGADGYVYALPMDRAVGGEVLIAHALNGAALGRRHGAPARAVVPGAYGEASAKWLTRISVLTRDEDGYYASQGWRAERVHTTSVIDRPVSGQVLRAGEPVAVAGVAFAGDRGVGRVELSTDGGATWTGARIDYAASPLAWALWSAAWTPPTPGRTALVVRAYDGAGAPQEAVAHGTVPAGATGQHRVEVRIA